VVAAAAAAGLARAYLFARSIDRLSIDVRDR